MLHSATNIHFRGRRSPTLSTRGIVASSQTLASQTGISILQQGGNAADAAIAVAAVLGLVEPCSTGLGGDCFALFYEAKSAEVRGINGSGRAGQAVDLETVRRLSQEMGPEFKFHAANVTVPGAAAAWVDIHQQWGSGNLTLQELLEPAVQLAREGFPVAPLTAQFW